MSSNLALGATYVHDFDGSFDGWQWQWHCPTCGEYVEPGEVFLSSERGYGDGWSLLFDMGNGAGDEGTLWIEKSFSVPANTPATVWVSFQLYNLGYSDFNRFWVKAYIGQDNPEEQADFTTIGETDTAVGWVPFSYEQAVTSDTGEMWVAVGIRVAWECHRDYWIDHVIVTAPVPGDFEPDGDVDFADFAVLALAWQSSPGDDNWNPDCDISIPADNSIDMLDLAVFVDNWLAGVE